MSKQRTIGEYFQKVSGEKLAQPGEVKGTNNAGDLRAGSPIPSSHNASKIRKLRELWRNVKIVTYNIESSRGTRILELAIEAAKEQVDILICTGT